MWDRCSEITLYILITPADVWKSQHFFKGPNTMSRILMLADFRPHVTLFLSNFPHKLSGIACTDSFPCIICDFMLKSIHFWRETEIRVHKYNGWTFWKLGISLLSSYKTLWWYSKKKIFNTHNSYWRLSWRARASPSKWSSSRSEISSRISKYCIWRMARCPDKQTILNC